MADNVTLPGTGEPVASDDVGGVQYQKIKLVDGTADSTAVIPGDATNGLDVDVTRVQGTVTVSGTVTASGPLTDTQLRASDVKVTLDSETVELKAGTATIGKLGSNSGVDIGDVDVLSMPGIGFVSTANSSTVALEVGQTFTGAWEDVSGYAEITVMAYYGDSSTNYKYLYVDFSSDGTNVDKTSTPLPVAVTLLETTSYTFPVLAKYARVRFSIVGGD